jgi:hypothetical protein
MVVVHLVCFAVGGDSLIPGEMGLAPAIAGFFLALAAPAVGLIAWLGARWVARRHPRRSRLAAGVGAGAALVVLALAAGCWFEVGPLADLARWVIG